MFGPSVTLFRVFGFAVRIDLSWIVVAALITWSLAEGYFKSEMQDAGATLRWTMGGLGALGLFASIVLHELGHSLAARRFGVEMRGITLFIFGGVAEMPHEPPSAVSELVIAVAGPIVSVVLAGGFFGLSLLLHGEGAPHAAAVVLSYLALMNGLLVAFNLIPAFPLDGGRVLRALLWAWKNNLRWATRITSAIGGAFGGLLMALGIVSLFYGNVVGAVWWFVLGVFLRNAARMSYQQLLTRKALEGERVRRFMKTDPVTVTGDVSLSDLVDEYIYKHHFKMIPVVDNGRLTGCVTTRQVREVPRERWPGTRVADVAAPCTYQNTVGPEDDAMDALAKMSRNQLSRLIVVDDGRVVGVLTLKDLLDFLSLKVELER